MCRIAEATLRCRRVTFRPAAAKTVSPDSGPGSVPGAVQIPVRAETGELLGVLQASDAAERSWSEGDRRLLEDLALQIRAWYDRESLLQACREGEERYRSLVDTTGDMIFSHDMYGRFLSVNRATQEITGYSPEQLLRMNAMDLVAPEYVDLLQERARARREGHTGRSTAELEMVTRSGGRVPVEVSTSLLLIDGVPAVVHGIARDITARRRMEEQLRQAQKLDAIGRLAGGVAHDFNNVLAVINGYADLLLLTITQQQDPDPVLLEGLQQILKAGQGASRLTRQLLAFGRKARFEPRELDLPRIVEEMETLLRRLLGEGSELRIEVTPGLPRVLADRGQIEQVILNLAVNARDAMPGGGLLEFRLSKHVITEEIVRSGGSTPPGPYVLMEVSDSGEGMDRTTLERLFEPFFTTKAADKGTGLGLATVYGIVRHGGGRIEVVSSPGQGSRFQVYLPAVESQATEGETHPV